MQGGGIKVCAGRSGDNQVGYAFINAVRFAYWKDRLFAVMLVNKPGDVSDFLTGLNVLYGPGKPGTPIDYTWAGTKVKIEYDLQPDQLLLTYTYLPIDQERQQSVAASLEPDL